MRWPRPWRARKGDLAAFEFAENEWVGWVAEGRLDAHLVLTLVNPGME